MMNSIIIGQHSKSPLLKHLPRNPSPKQLINSSFEKSPDQKDDIDLKEVIKEKKNFLNKSFRIKSPKSPMLKHLK